MNQNKIKNTKVGDDIHFYVNGVEDRGIVVKMNNEYVTVFKESTQNYDDIHINDTFFIKDIMINKEWDMCSDQERFELLKNIHAPSPRYLQKTWNDLPKDIKELLRKNNSNQQGFKKDDDENITARTFDQQKTDPQEIDNNYGKQSLKAEDTEKASSGDINKKPIVPEGEVAGDITAKRISGGFKETQHIKDQKENPNIGQGSKITTRQHGTEEREPSTEEQKGEARGGKKDSGKEAGDAWMKYFKESQTKKTWNTWLEERQAQINKDGRDDKWDNASEDQKKRATESGNKKFGGKEIDGNSHSPDSKWRASDDFGATPAKLDAGKVSEASSEELRRASAGAKRQLSGELGNITQREGTGKQPDKKIEAGVSALKSWEELIEEAKSSVENSVHGNAARNPTAGVNTNTNFDAPKDYEGFSHSGVRPEQFKHEEKKPKVGQEKKKKEVKVDDKPADRVNSQTNKYETNQENKDTDGRATNQVKDKI